jgi:hypothetical protein
MSEDVGPLMTTAQRRFLQRLRTDQWRSLASATGATSERLLVTITANGWIERSGTGLDREVKMTSNGLEAFRAILRCR